MICMFSLACVSFCLFVSKYFSEKFWVHNKVVRNVERLSVDPLPCSLFTFYRNYQTALQLACKILHFYLKAKVDPVSPCSLQYLAFLLSFYRLYPFWWICSNISVWFYFVCIMACWWCSTFLSNDYLRSVCAMGWNLLPIVRFFV